VAEVVPAPGSAEYREQVKRMQEAFGALAGFFVHDEHDICPPTGTPSKRKSVIGEGAVANAKAATNRRNAPSLWINGVGPSFADFSLVSCLVLLRLNDSLWNEVNSINSGRWEKYFSAASSLFMFKDRMEGDKS
jgi:hypothetical protein